MSNATQTDADGQTSTDAQLSEKSTAVTILLGVFLSPLAYYYVGRTKLAVINFLTLNSLGLGFMAVPIHAYKILNDGRRA
jgi:hypothetical protein